MVRFVSCHTPMPGCPRRGMPCYSTFLTGVVMPLCPTPVIPRHSHEQACHVSCHASLANAHVMQTQMNRLRIAHRQQRLRVGQHSFPRAPLLFHCTTGGLCRAHGAGCETREPCSGTYMG